jgi:hypothetical protein
MRTSRGTILAIDSGTPDQERSLSQAGNELVDAQKKRAGLERRAWRPGTRARLVAAREREALARERVEVLSRAVVEQRHAQRLFIDDLHDKRRRAAPGDRIVERPGPRNGAGDRAVTDSWLTELLTSAQMTDLLHMKRSTIEDYAVAGCPRRSSSGYRRFVRSDVEAALAELRSPAAGRY